jgi:TatD DNase family protein
MLFDSHAHLNDSRFDKDRDQVIQRAKASGIDYIMNPGADYESSLQAIALAEKYEFIYAAVGIHPHDAKSLDDMMLSLLKAMAKKNKVKAIGEIGLDYHYDHSARDIQKYWFEKQLLMAKELKLPVIIHDREANQDVFDILTKVDSFETGVLLHCYSGSGELAKEYIKKGAYISLAGPVTFKNARKPVEVVEEVPLDRLMIETDSPYLTPEPYRGKRNESSYVSYVAKKIAEIKGCSYEAVAYETMKNAKKFFDIE